MRWPIRRGGEPLVQESADRYYVLGQLVRAVTMLSEASDVAALLPEVRSNLVMAVQGAKSVEEVAGIPGRLTAILGKIIAPGYPAWGASINTSRILLAMMEYDPVRRATMELRYSEELVNLLQSKGLSPSHLTFENWSLHEMLAASMKNGVLPTVFYTEGGFAREGAVILTGNSAVEVAGLVRDIAGWMGRLLLRGMRN